MTASFKERGKGVRGWRRAALLFALAASLIAQPALAAVEVSAVNEGDGKRLTFHWPEGTSGEAKVSGRTLSVTFSKPLEADLTRIADLMQGTASFVRLSADHKTLLLTLAKEMSVTSEALGSDVVVRLTPGVQPPAATPLPQAVVAPSPATGAVQAANAQAVPVTPAPVATAITPPVQVSIAPVSSVASAPPPQETQKLAVAPKPSEVSTAAPAKVAAEKTVTAKLESAKPESVSALPAITEPELRVSKGDDYTRLLFEFPRETAYTAALAEGQLNLSFKSDKPVRLTQLRVDPPPRVRSATGVETGDTFSAQIGVTPGVELRQYQEGNVIVVDLVDPKPAPDAAAAPQAGAPADTSAATENPPDTEQAAAALPAKSDTPSVTADASSHAAAPKAPDGPATASAEHVEAVPSDATAATVPPTTAAPVQVAHEVPDPLAVPAPPPAPPEGNTGATPPPGTIKSVLDIKDIDVSALDERLKNPALDDETDSHDPSNAEANPVEFATPDVFPPLPSAEAEPPAQKFKLGIMLGTDAVRLNFPWGSAVPAAVVRRGERLWIAFGGRANIDLTSLDALRDRGVQAYGSFPASGATIVGLQLDEHILATVMPDAAGWTIALGDSILTTAPDIALESRLDSSIAEVAAIIPGDLKVAQFRDSDVHDDLVFIMSGKPQGLVSTRRFVDFEVLASAQGVAVRPMSDGVDVRIEPGHAVISRPGGLALSGTHMPGDPAAELAKPKAPPVKVSPLEMKFAEWRGSPEVSFSDGQKQRLVKVANTDKDDHLQAQLDMVHYLMSYQLPEEALGLMEVMATESPAVTSDLHYRALRGVASLMAGRLADAKRDLDPRTMPDDAHAEIWLGMLAAAQHDWPRARVLFAEAGPVIDKLDAPWQARARLAAAEAALALNDVTNARMNLEFMPREGLEPAEAGQAALLDAQLAEALGQFEKAMAGYDKLAKGAIEPLAVKAELARTRLAARRDQITVDEAIDRLEALRFQWRGDAIEADTLLGLGQLYARLGDYRHALTTMKIAVRHFPGTTLERQITQEMYEMFEELYLGGKADQMPPIQALALYYDFKELTPIGPKGDVMIRHLSDRLVAMDLLDQATELLAYQVENRLRGVARSQVATRLALVQLMNRKAEDALRTITNTRQARLPEMIAAQRRLIEARALMDLKRYEAALDVVSTDQGTSIDRLRADIYWHQDDWGKAGSALEGVLGGAWNAPAPLDESQRFDVMRASIAYVLGEDKQSLARMAKNYAAKMSNTPDAHAFTVVVSDPGNANLELHSLTEKLASIDTLSAFLDDLKKTEEPQPPAPSVNPPTN